MKKKFLTLTLTLVCAFSAAGCGTAPAGGNENVENVSGTEASAEGSVSVPEAENSESAAPESQEADMADTAAAEADDDPYEFIIELEGHTYQLPCLVSELLANGFTINEENSELNIPAGSLGQIELVYNGQSYYPFVYNVTDSDTTPENSLLSSMSSSINGPDYALTIFRGITRGMSEEDLKAALEGIDHDVDTVSSDTYTYYEVSEPDGGSRICYRIIVADSEVVTIIMSTQP